jgi:tetratricopeptide (TPR) repeat protein
MIRERQPGVLPAVPGRYDEALADPNRAIGLDPSDAKVIGTRGRTYREMGRHDEALDDYARAIELDPTTDPRKD